MEFIDLDYSEKKELKGIVCVECEKKVKLDEDGKTTVAWYKDEDEYMCGRCYDGNYGLDEEEEEGMSDIVEKWNKD